MLKPNDKLLTNQYELGRHFSPKPCSWRSFRFFSCHWLATYERNHWKNTYLNQVLEYSSEWCNRRGCYYLPKAFCLLLFPLELDSLAFFLPYFSFFSFFFFAFRFFFLLLLLFFLSSFTFTHLLFLTSCVRLTLMPSPLSLLFFLN